MDKELTQKDITIEQKKEQIENKQKNNNKLCLASFIISIVSFFISIFGIVAIISVILAIIGIVNFDKNEEKGRWLGIIAIIIGAISFNCTISLLIDALSLI